MIVKYSFYDTTKMYFSKNKHESAKIKFNFFFIFLETNKETGICF
ncbi:protein of unknown function [Legionella micdadei]|uniref:Uncharacterized protein n=1 Tax=Legionella micdadei TaxID=451 RepID=A0A098GGR3_LEGMI|nr:protein of unknown function [Legionella micdadei]